MNKWKILLACGALCAASSVAFAGGPEMPPAGHSTVFVGIGGAYDYVQSQIVAGVFETADPALLTTQFQFNPSLFGLAPAGQLGYEYFFGGGGFLGVKGVFYYTNKNDTLTDTTDGVQVTLEAQSMVQAMLEGGYSFDNNAIYLEGGYAALFTNTIARNSSSGGLVLGTSSQTFNGGVAGIGFRHYFWDVISVDAAYSYALFADGNTINSSSSVLIDGEIPGTAYGQGKRLSVQDILFTVNYNFNF